MRSEVFQTAKGEMEASITGSGRRYWLSTVPQAGSTRERSTGGIFRGAVYLCFPAWLFAHAIGNRQNPAEQADALAALLDTLGIRRAGFIGTSTGGLVGIYFALRHPERCSALVLVSAVNAPLPSHLTHYGRFSPLLQADFLLGAVPPGTIRAAEPDPAQAGGSQPG